jgi:hypothetical protein
LGLLHARWGTSASFLNFFQLFFNFTFSIKGCRVRTSDAQNVHCTLGLVEITCALFQLFFQLFFNSFSGCCEKIWCPKCSTKSHQFYILHHIWQFIWQQFRWRFRWSQSLVQRRHSTSKESSNSPGSDKVQNYFNSKCPSSSSWALVGLSFTRENKLLIFLVCRGRACCSRLQNVWYRSALYFSVIALLKIKTNQEKNKALKMSTPKPFSQWTVIALREFLKERGVRSSDLKAQLVYRWR